MEIIFLGTGTSTGIPQIGCQCDVCQSVDSKDKRLRSSIIIDTGNETILIDSGPDLRQQLIENKVNAVTAILLTHEHYDHIGGLDDIRPLGESFVYAESKVLHTIRRNMPYCFSDYRYPGVPKMKLIEIENREFTVGHSTITPIRVMHAKLPILGFRTGNFAYLTDVKTIPEDSYEQLRNLDVLVINSLRLQEHISHLSLEESTQIALRIGAKRTYFTHLSHDMGKHEDVSKRLHDGFQIAYDGLRINC